MLLLMSGLLAGAGFLLSLWAMSGKANQVIASHERLPLFKDAPSPPPTSGGIKSVPLDDGREQRYGNKQ